MKRLGLILFSLFSNFESKADCSTTVNTYIDSFWNTVEFNLTKATEYVIKAEDLALGCKNPLDLATTYNAKGYALQKTPNSLELSRVYFFKALKLRKKYGDSSLCMSVKNNLGHWHMMNGTLDSAVCLFREFIGYWEKKERPHILLLGKRNLAIALQKNGSYQKANALLRQNLASAKGFNDSFEVSQAALNLGFFYGNQRRYKAQLAMARTCIDWLPTKLAKGIPLAKAQLLFGNAYFYLGSYDSSLTYYSNCLVSANKNGDQVLWYDALNSIARLEEVLGHLDSAEAKLIRVLTFWSQDNDPVKFSLASFDLGRLYLRKGKLEEALKILKEGRRRCIQTQHLFLQLDFCDELGEVYGKLGQFDSAFHYQSISANGKDSLQKLLLKPVEWELEKSRKDEEIKALRIKSLEKEKERMNFIIIIAISAAVVLLLIAILIVARLRWKAKLALNERELERQKVDKLLKTQELSSIMNVLEVQEQERKRIAQDLHDRLGSMLSMVKLHFKNTEKNLERLQEQNRDEYNKATSLLDEACDEVRKIAHNLISGVLKKFGLVAALKDLKQTVVQSGQLEMEVLTTRLDERMTWEYELNIYRIIQELLANTMKHAEATEVSVQLLRNNGNLSIVYEDDGRGFDPAKLSEGMGMKNIASRLDKLNGKMEIDSGKGGGTTFTFDIIINEDGEDKGFVSR